MNLGKLLWVFVAGWLWAGGVAAKTIDLRQAEAVITVGALVEKSTVQLPYFWDKLHVAQAGRAVFEIPFYLQQPASEHHAAYFSRIGTAYEVWLNGVLIAQGGDLDAENGSDMSKAPRLISFPPQILQSDNLLRINLRADANRRSGLSTVLIGPEVEVSEPYRSSYRRRVVNSLVMAIVSLCVGVMAFGLWLTQPGQPGPFGRVQRDPLYGLVGVSALAWAVRVGEAIVEVPVLPWPGWGVFTAFAYVVWVTFTFLFCHHVMRPVSSRGWLLALFCLSSGMTVVCLALLSGQSWGWAAWTIWLGMLALWSVGYSFWYVWRAWCERLEAGHVERWVIAGALSLAVAAGVRELIDVTTSSDFYGESSAARYTSLLFGMAFIYIVVHRFRQASTELRDLTINLTHRVAQREQALAVSYANLEVLAREQSRTTERARILRDMHDGVGAHISTAIRQLESGRATQGDVLHTLRDSLDQLKLSIDAMNLPAGDITALLANLRYRLEPRLRASDIELLWDVDLVPPLAQLDDKAMRHLQYMVFEAISNVLQHARASVLRIELHNTSSGGALLQLIDNGCGFDAGRVTRRGLSSLRERAAAIGARLEIESRPGKTVVAIALNGLGAG